MSLDFTYGCTKHITDSETILSSVLVWVADMTSVLEWPAELISLLMFEGPVSSKSIIPHARTDLIICRVRNRHGSPERDSARSFRFKKLGPRWLQRMTSLRNRGLLHGCDRRLGHTNAVATPV